MENATSRALPDWFEAVSADYTAGVANAYVLHGTVHDYVEDALEDVTITNYLAGRLCGDFTVVAYAPDRGITFPGAESDDPGVRQLAAAAETRFRAVLGMTSELDPLEQLAAAAGAGETAGGQKLPKAPAAAVEALLTFLQRAYGGAAVKESGVIVGTDPDDPGDGSGLRAMVIIERLDLIAPPCDKGTLDPGGRAMLAGLHRVGTQPDVQARGGLLVMLAPSLEAVHDDLKLTSTGIRAIPVTPPTLAQRTAYLTRMAADPDRQVMFADDMTLEDVAKQTAGLGRRHLEDIVLRAIQRTDGIMTHQLVVERRQELLDVEYSGILEVIDSRVTLDMVGGHELAIAHLQEEVIPLLKAGDPDAPMGVMLAGPAGTGKTFLALAVASALGWRMVKLRAENIKGKYVGESEQKLAKALVGIEANAPCVLFLDEVDQSIRRGEGGGSGGDSVDNNIFGRLLEWLSDTSHRGQILSIAATNRPDNLDAAFLRPGRFDTKIPLLVAQSPEEREAMLTRLLRRSGDGWDCPAVAAIAATTDGWTAAELENLVLLARRIARLKSIPVDGALRQARARLKAATRSVEEMTLLALSICDDNALIPPAWLARMAQDGWEASVREAEDGSLMPGPRGPRSGGPRRGRTL